MAVIFVATGVGLSGGPIMSSGTINLLPPTGPNIGGVKAGNNITISPDGTISAPPPGVGTITGVTAGTGLTGGGTVGNVTLGLTAATSSVIGGVTVGSGLDIVGANLRIKTASLTERGGVILASDADVLSGTDNTKAVTPSSLLARTATTSRSGLVQLEDSTTSTSTTKAATANSVKFAYDAAAAAATQANNALPLTGGVMLGPIIFALGQTFPGVSLPIATATSPGVVIPSTGLAISAGGYLTTTNNGTVTSVTAGVGLGAPVTGNAITTAGVIKLLPPSSDGSTIGGVKAGANILIQTDGEITTQNLLQTNNPYAYNSYIWPAVTTPVPGAPGSNGQVLTLKNRVTGEVGWTNTGTLQSVVAGQGVSVSSTSTTATVSLTTVPSVTPGQFGGTALIPTFTVNAYGQLTSVGSANPFTSFQTPTVTAPFILVLDFTTNNTNWSWTLQGNTTIENPLNAVPGQTGALLIAQNALSTYSLNWGSSWKFANFSPYSGSTTLAAVDMVQFTVVSANYIVVTNVITNLG